MSATQTTTPKLTESQAEAVRRSGDARLRALRLPLASNVLLVVSKLAVAAITGSVSVFSEAVHSFADLLVTGMQVVTVRWAARPADRDHAYGHGKFENVSAMIEAIVIFGTAGLIVYEAVVRLQHATPIVHLDLGIGVMLTSAAVNVFVAARLDRASREEQSPALRAEAVQLRADVMTAVGVAITLIIVRFTGLLYLDAITSLVVAGLIVHSAYAVSARAILDLTDGRLPPDAEARIADVIRSHADVYVNYHKLRTRSSGGSEFIDFHLKMPSGLSLKEAHDLSDRIVVDIKRSFPRAHVLIHLEPDE